MWSELAWVAYPENAFYFKQFLGIVADWLDWFFHYTTVEKHIILEIYEQNSYIIFWRNMIKYSFLGKKWRVWIFNMVYLLHAKQQHFHFLSFVNIISIMCMQQNFTTYFLVHNLNVKWGKQRRSIHTWIWSVFSSVFCFRY